jgi:glycerate 2-kinase
MLLYVSGMISLAVRSKTVNGFSIHGKRRMSKTIIVSDLDGTLLDASSYSFNAALPALSLVRKLDIPLILCSSKTRAEIEVCRHSLNNQHPFISENGGGIFIPTGYFAEPVGAELMDGYSVITLGVAYPDIVESFAELRRRLSVKVRGFHDMSCEEVSKLTGLSLAESRLAKQRDFDEPFIFEDAPCERFLRAIELSGMRWTQGRIFHIMGDHDKGRAVDILKSLYQRQHGSVVSIGLGDSLNDLPMLMAVNHPVLVRHPDERFDKRILMPSLLKTQLPGPAGWNDAVLHLLSPQATVSTDREILLSIFNAALAAVDPYNAVMGALGIENNRLQLVDAKYDLGLFERIVVVGAGKATARMAQAIETLLDKKNASGLIVVKEGHTAPLSVIEQIEAAHPVPDEAGMLGAQRILQMMHEADDRTLVICLLSGGASALLVSPVEGLTLQDKQEMTRLLLNAGASISELNAVRKHLSRIKGGRLAQAAYPASMLALILSDVIGDSLDVIASGPTAPDASTFADALSVIAKYDLAGRLPPQLVGYLQQGIDGHRPETVKPADPCLEKTQNAIVASNRQALMAANEKALQSGFIAKIVDDALSGEARDAAIFLAQAARSELSRMKPGERRCLLCGGETTVTVRGAGKGGRNQELALAFALEIEDEQGISLLSAGTDGSDGPTDAAGALVDGTTASRARNLGLDPFHYLERNDSYAFFHQYDAIACEHCHLKTGPTGTNVMDIQIVLLCGQEHHHAS